MEADIPKKGNRPLFPSSGSKERTSLEPGRFRSGFNRTLSVPSLRKWISLFLLAGGGLHGQGTGDAAIATAQIATSNNWQNWTFAASALVTAATAILVVSIDDGHSVQSTTH